MTLMIHRLKKTTSVTVSSSQKLSEMRHYNFHVIKFRKNRHHFTM